MTIDEHETQGAACVMVIMIAVVMAAVGFVRVQISFRSCESCALRSFCVWDLKFGCVV
jgi:hypothetical protein